MALPTINNTNPYKIHDFYKRLITHINTLDTMGRLREINGYVRFTLDKLCGIRGDLVRTDGNWQNWGFNEQFEAIRKWTERNPIERLERSDRLFKQQHRGEHIMQTRQNTKTRECIYCGGKDHKAIACNIIQDINERRSSPLRGFILTALVKDIVSVIAKAKEALRNVKDIITRHYVWMRQTRNHPLQEQGPIIQLQGRNSLPHQRVNLSTRLL